MLNRVVSYLGILGALSYATPASAAKIWVTITDTSITPTQVTVRLNDSFVIQNKGSRGSDCSITRNILNNFNAAAAEAVMPGATLVYSVIEADSGVTYLACSGRRVTITYVK